MRQTFLQLKMLICARTPIRYFHWYILQILSQFTNRLLETWPANVKIAGSLDQSMPFRISKLSISWGSITDFIFVLALKAFSVHSRNVFGPPAITKAVGWGEGKEVSEPFSCVCAIHSRRGYKGQIAEELLLQNLTRKFHNFGGSIEGLY